MWKIHRSKLWLPDLTGLKTDGITDLSTLARIAVRTGYTPYDPAKSIEHNSAGTFDIRLEGGHYTDISNWDAGEASDLVTEDAGHSIARCYDDWPTGLVDTIDLDATWVSDVDNMPQITVATGNRHNGTAESGFFIRSPSNTRIIISRTDFAYVNGVEFQASNAAISNCLYSLADTDQFDADNLIVHDFPGTSIVGVHTNADVSTWRNCAVWDWMGGRRIAGTGNNGTFYNCVFFESGNDTDTILLRDATFYNCVAFSSSTMVNGVFFAGCLGDYNAGSDASAPGANSNHNMSLNDLLFVSTTGGSEDFHITTESLLRDEGFAFGGMFGTDVDGDAWASPPAIGFDEVVAVGDQNPQLVDGGLVNRGLVNSGVVE